MSSLVPTAPVAHDVVDDVQLVARSPDDMQRAQQSLSAWVSQKIAILERDFDDATQNSRLAVSSKISPKVFDRQCDMLRRRIQFYEKIQQAVGAGYCIVPNFPVDIFAIRTTRKAPKRGESTYSLSRFEQHPMKLPAGAGEYQDNLPVVSSRVESRTDREGKEIQQRVYYPSDWPEEIDFPVSVVKPVVMSATTQAMALKCFDSLGIAGGRHQKGDPIVVGHIYDPRDRGFYRFVTFLIAWWVDTRDLD